ncbi:F-box protein [Trifolium pratense]|uniref:F-box protein n=1 Tax=Trifolium pratense TaxID=57577 RepID=A0A2K3N9F1_TRIPR|nr:F-box protein [Trifolium pratense]
MCMVLTFLVVGVKDFSINDGGACLPVASRSEGDSEKSTLSAIDTSSEMEKSVTLTIMGKISLYLVSGDNFENKVKLDTPLPSQELDRKVVLWNPATDELKVIPPSPVEYITSFRIFFYRKFMDLVMTVLRMTTRWTQDPPWSEDTYEAYLVSFDVSNEVFFTTPMPDDSFDLGLVESHLVMLNGYIALISYYGETATFYISILGEIGVKESWTKLFIVGSMSIVERPIGAGKKGNILFMKKDGELAYFDLDTQMIVELGFEGNMCQC